MAFTLKPGQRIFYFRNGTPGTVDLGEWISATILSAGEDDGALRVCREDTAETEELDIHTSIVPLDDEE